MILTTQKLYVKEVSAKYLLLHLQLIHIRCHRCSKGNGSYCYLILGCSFYHQVLTSYNSYYVCGKAVFKKYETTIWNKLNKINFYSNWTGEGSTETNLRHRKLWHQQIETRRNLWKEPSANQGCDRPRKECLRLAPASLWLNFISYFVLFFTFIQHLIYIFIHT